MRRLPLPAGTRQLWDQAALAMLRSVSVRELVVIPHLDIEFASGLTVVTGESGVGKSALLEALALVLGGRAASDLSPRRRAVRGRTEMEAPAGGEAAVHRRAGAGRRECSQYSASAAGASALLSTTVQ